MSASPARLLSSATCPHCWKTFAPEDTLWVAVHQSQRGDSKLGGEAMRRFLPSRFTVDADAIDPNGLACRDLACPHCHLLIPRASLGLKPLFVSILGTPSAGKSFFLTSMVHQLRALCSREFLLHFTDADPALNQQLLEYEESVFNRPDPESFVDVADLIRKTELQGDLYHLVNYDDQTVQYPRPFLFTLVPDDRHPNAAEARKLARLLCVYDNAGEHFLAGADTPTNPVTQHLARAAFWLFLFDPTQDSRFHRWTGGGGPPPARANRQDVVLTEAAGRVRRALKLSPAERLHLPIVVVVTKGDLWRHKLDADFDATPYAKSSGGVAMLDMPLVKRRSDALRAILSDLCPETVSTAEAVSRDVYYVGVSALGTTPRPMPDAPGRYGVKPGDIAPLHAALPFVLGLRSSLPGLVGARVEKR